MANPLVTGAKALLKGTDEATRAARDTADGFSDEALQSLNVKPDVEQQAFNDLDEMPFSERFKIGRESRLSLIGASSRGNVEHITDMFDYTPEQSYAQLVVTGGRGNLRRGGYLVEGDQLNKLYKPDGTSQFIDKKTGKVIMDNDVEQTQNLIKDDILSAKESSLTPEQKQQAYDKAKAERDEYRAQQAEADSTYHMAHKAPRRGDDPTGENLSSAYGDDIYSDKALQFYGTGASYDDKAIKIIKGMQGNPDKEVTIYRAVPKDVSTINEGDWVTTTKEYAKDHMEGEEGWHIITKKVKAGDIANDGNSIHEFGYSPNKALAVTVVGVTALGGSLVSEEAKAAPLETEEFNALLLDQEGVTTDAAYNEMLTAREIATQGYEFNQLLDEDSVIGDIGKGVVEAPLQALGGMADAVNETLDMTKELGDWLNENFVDLGGVVWDEDGIRLASGDEISEAENIQIPTTGKSDSTTSEIVRGISQFLTGFVGAGKLAPLKAIKPATTAGKIGKASAQGAVADFSVFDPQEKRLSNLVEEFPELKNPVTAYLAADENDSAAEGRFKNALEGLGLGAVADTAIEGLTKGIRALKATRKGKATTEGAGLGTKTGERFDPDITPEDIESAINGESFKKPEGVDEDVIKADIDFTKTVQEKDGEVFINWARIDAPEDVKIAMRDMANSMKPEIDEARRGKQTFEQIQLNAEGVDAWDTLSQRRKGQPLNAEQSLAARELWARSADNLARVSKEAALNPTPQNLMAFRKMAAVHHSIQREVIAARTETARALASWRIPASSIKMDEVEQILALGGGSDGARLMAQQIADLAEQGMLKEMDDFIEKSALAKTSDAIKQAFYFSLLSGPKTHLRNIAGATSAMAQQVYERKAANLLGQALGDVNVADGEAFTMISAVTRGIREAFVTSSKGKRVLQQAKQLKQEGKIAEAEKLIEESGSEVSTLRKYAATGKSGWGTGKVDETQVGAFDPEVWNVQRESFIGRGLSLINNVTMTPMHALGIMDELFTTIGSRMEINAQAVRQATSEVNGGKIPQDQLKTRIQELMDSPTNATKDVSREFAKTITFTNQPENTRPWQAFNAVSKFPVIGTIIMPFTRTPFNIAKYTFERTPMAPLVKQWRDDMAAGGARADLALAKTATGSMIMLAMADIAMNGDITGEGPSDPKEKEQLRRTGWQPNSIRVPQEDGTYNYYAVAGMEPFSTPLMLASNMVEIMQNSDIGEGDVAVEQAWLAATMAVANQVTSQQYMSGVSGFFEMMSDPQRYGQSWANRLVGATVPTGVAEITRAMDPYARTAYTMAETIKRRTPGLSKDLPVNTDVWGRPISYRSHMGSLYDTISPSYASTTKKMEPIDEELNRLEKYVSKPNKKANFNGTSINLRKYPRAYADMVKFSNDMTKTKYGAPIDIDGDTMLETLNNLVAGGHSMSPLYQMMTDGSDGGKAQMIQGIVTKFQNAAKQKVLDEHEDVRAEYNLKQSEMNTKYKFQKGL